MTKHNRCGPLCLLATVLLNAMLLIPAASAQVAGATPDGTVTAAGSATIERKPDAARMQVELSAQGKDAREALANLKAQEKAVREKLAKLGASEEMVKFEDARIDAAGNDRRSQMEQMIRMRSARPGKPPTTGPSQPPVNVTVTLKVEWRLKAASAEDLLVEAYDLQAKVKAANLVAPAKATGATPEELEEAEERLGMAMADMGMNGGANPGEPTFMYVSRMTDDERAKATAEAFKKAKDEAARVAKAAGAELGTLRQLTSAAGAEMDGQYDYSSPYGRQYYNMMQRQQAGGAADNAEAIGMQPGKVGYRVTVSASFALK